MFDLQKIVRPNILALQPYSSARDEFKGKTGIFLDANENPYGILNRYPDPYQKVLKEKLAKLKMVNTNNIFIGNGSDEVIDLAFRIFCEPSKDKALTFSPTYGMYQVSAAINAIELVKIPLTKDFQIDEHNLAKYLKDSTIKLIFLCSPNNPTGNVFEEKAIENILNNFKGIVLIDEAYVDFSSTKSWVEKVNKYPNLMVSQTFSKAWGLAAARVGVAYAQSSIIDLFNKVKPPYNVSRLNQEAAIKALENQATFEQQKQTILAEKQLLIKALEKLALIEKIYPSDANFVLVKVANANQIYQELVKQKIIIRNRHKLVNNCLRFSIGTPAENQTLLTALNKISTHHNSKTNH